jgi:hypothetical protein
MNGDYLKKVMVSHTPPDFVAADSFRFGLTNEEIVNGINAFRSFLYKLYDTTADDALMALLYFMGVQGRLEAAPERKLIINGSDLLTKTKKHSIPHQAIKKLSGKRAAQYFALLAEMGFCFENIDCSKAVKLAEAGVFHVSNKNDGDIIVGLKLLAKAHRHVLSDWERLQYHFMRCDFYPLASETSQWYGVRFFDCVDTQPPEIKKWLVDLHTLLTESGCAVDGDIFEYANFTYTLSKPNRVVCRIDMHESGCKVTPNTQKTKCLDEIAPVLSPDFAKALAADVGCAQCDQNCKKGPYRVVYNDHEYLIPIFLNKFDKKKCVVNVNAPVVRGLHDEAA